MYRSLELAASVALDREKREPIDRIFRTPIEPQRPPVVRVRALIVVPNKKLVAPHGVNLTVVPSKGSVENVFLRRG